MLLLIYEMIPDDTLMYLFDNLTEEEYKNIVCVHSSYTNGTELTEEQEDAHMWLTDWLAIQKDKLVYQWSKEFGTKEPVSAKITKIVHTGTVC